MINDDVSGFPRLVMHLGSCGFSLTEALITLDAFSRECRGMHKKYEPRVRMTRRTLAILLCLIIIGFGQTVSSVFSSPSTEPSLKLPIHLPC